MPQSYSQILIHIVFSTKNRRPVITDGVRDELHAYMVGILRRLDCQAVIIESVEDHVHLLFALSRKQALSEVAAKIKSVSSKWMKTRGDDFKDFQWQSGYGAFSVSMSNIDAVRNYISGQKQHHKKMSFKEELVKLLEKHRVEYDVKYLWS